MINLSFINFPDDEIRPEAHTDVVTVRRGRRQQPTFVVDPSTSVRVDVGDHVVDVVLRQIVT